MKIGIDISQTAYGTGVGNFTLKLVENLLENDTKNKYVLFFSSMRRQMPKIKNVERAEIKKFRFPPTFLDFLWNKLHIIPIEWLIGDIDVFVTSDWTEPPAKAKKATILYDLIVYKYPEESHHKTEFNPLKLLISPNIVEIQKRKLKWVKKESDKIICISESSKKDAEEILGIEPEKLSVVYPGYE